MLRLSRTLPPHATRSAFVALIRISALQAKAFVLTIAQGPVVLRLRWFFGFWGLKRMVHNRRHTDVNQWSTTLTQREREVVQLAVEGLTAREIGARLFIGARTVETHLASAYLKLGIRSRFFLIRKAKELGF